MGRKPTVYMSEPQGWMNMLRISNSPTVVSNVMVGVGLAIVAHSQRWSDRIHPPPIQLLKPFVVITVVLLTLYFAGMILNDAFDAKRDRELRPKRAIPLGIISAKQAWITGLIMVAVATLLSFKVGVAAGISTSILAFVVLLYTFLHHTTLLAIPLMAICRALVYVVALSAFSTEYSTTLYIYCGAIALYTAILTLVGSVENEKQSKYSWVVWATLISAAVPALLYGFNSPIVWMMLVAFLIWTFLAWNHFRQTNYAPILGMHKLISGFALLDCVLIASIEEYFIMIISAICFVFTVAAHRKILGT